MLKLRQANREMMINMASAMNLLSAQKELRWRNQLKNQYIANLYNRTVRHNSTNTHCRKQAHF